MNEKESFHDVWAAADKPLIDIMKKTSNPLSKAPHQKDSSESSNSDSDSSSEGSFSAVPREFRPNLELNKSPTKDAERNTRPNQCSSLSLSSQPPSQISLKKNFLLNNLALADSNSILEKKTISQDNLLLSETKDLPKEQSSSNKTSIMENYNSLDSNDVSGNDSKPSKAYGVSRFKNFRQHQMQKRKPALPPTPNQVFHSKCENKIDHCTEFEKKIGHRIEFENTDFSNQIARVKTIELDFANLSIDNNKRDKEVEFQVLQNNSEQKCFARQRGKETKLHNSKRNRNSFKHHGEIRSRVNKMAHNSTESSNFQFTAVLQKSACVRWDSTLSLNKSSKSSPDFAFPKPENKDQNFNKLPNSNKIGWTFVRKERTFISATRLDDDESDSDHEPIYEKAVNFTYDKKFIQGTSRDSSQNAKSNIGWEVNGKRCFLNTKPMQNTCKQHPLHLGNNADWGRPSNSGTHLCKISNNAPNFEQTNINVNQKTGTLPHAWIQKQHNYKQMYTTHEENDQTHCKTIDARKGVHMQSCVTNTPKFPYEIKKDSQSKCDQYVNLSKENSQQKKMDNYDLHVQKESLSQVKSNNLTTAAEKHHQLIEYGKEIADVIIGSYTTLSIFISFYNEWNHTRLELITHFEELEVSLKDSCKNNNRLRDVLKIANTGTTIAASLPIPHISIAAKVISLLTGLASVFIGKKNTGKVDDEDPEIVRLLVKDIEASSEFYMYCLMCNQQFEETIKLIEKFHSSAVIREFFDSDCEDIANFLRGVLEYNPMHRIFYKKLHKCFQELLQKGSSELSRRFCEPFVLHSSNAIDVIECLEWRFVEDFDNTSVKYELEEIHKLIENSNSTSMSDLLKKIRNCIAILKDELNYVKKSVSKVSLFDNSFGNKKLDPK